MTDRDRLIELQIKAYKEWKANTNMETSVAEFVADYLLANGVIVSPLKLWDKIYRIFDNKIVKIEVSDIEIEFRSFGGKKYRYNYQICKNRIQRKFFENSGKMQNSYCISFCNVVIYLR